MPGQKLSPALQTAALTLRVDATTVEIVSGMRQEGVRPILLKGPSIAAWLYADGPPRPYGDTDLMVAPQALHPASRVLRAAGFREQPGVSSQTWFRRSDQSIVDLHGRLFGVEASHEEAWAVLSQGTESLRIGGMDVETLSRPARLLYIALHAAQHESDGFEQPQTDLRQALRRVDERHWKDAAALATRLAAAPTFAAGLRLQPDGSRLADRMNLPRGRPLMLSLREGADQSLAATIERVATTPGLGPRVRLLGRRLAPPPDYMRWRYPSLAGRGGAGLLLAYLWRPLSVAGRLPGAVVRRRRLRRGSER